MPRGLCKSRRNSGGTGVCGELQSLGQRLVASSFPHPVVESRLIETHISWVILTGPWAYRVKKPIRLEFLDYSTPDLREQCCERELELNRRWAPQIYQGLVPIFQLAARSAGTARSDGMEGGLRVGVAGEQAGAEERLVDHAVRKYSPVNGTSAPVFRLMSDS